MGLFGSLGKIGKKIFGGAKKAVKGIAKGAKGLVKGVFDIGKSLLNPKTLVQAGLSYFVSKDWKTALGMGLSSMEADYVPLAKLLVAKRYELLPDKAMYEWGGIPFIGKNTLASYMKEVDVIEDTLSERLDYSKWKQSFLFEQEKYKSYIGALEQYYKSKKEDQGLSEEDKEFVGDVKENFNSYMSALTKILNLDIKGKMPIDLGVPENEAPSLEGSWFDYDFFGEGGKK